MAKGKNSPGATDSSKSATNIKSAKKTAVRESGNGTAAAKAAHSAATSKSQPLPADLQEEIRLRAYQIYCERGGAHGMHDADWHRAELEVRAKYNQ